MKIKTVINNGQKIAVVSSDGKLIKDVQSALDLIMTVTYETQADKVVINKENIIEDFFILSTCLAGEVLQKFITYKVNVAIYGDYSKYTSKPLKDFIYESNKGKNIFFVETQQQAIEKLSQQ